MKLICTILIIYYCLFGTAYAQQLAISEHWKFAKSEADAASVVEQADWTAVTLPHTWNGDDGQDGRDDYFRGTGWYMRDLPIDMSDRDKCLYLRFGAANLATEAFLNGVSVGTHFGGYTAFAFDITSFVRYGATNRLLVKVSNVEGLAAPPLSADFTFFGGLIRGVELIKKNKVHITAQDYGSCGVYVRQDKVTDAEAQLSFITKIRNTQKKAQKTTISYLIKERDGKVVAEGTQEVRIASGATMPVTESIQINHPHLWNGKKDPYLYSAEVNVRVGSKVIDTYSLPLGIRYYSIHPDKGFLLNGHSYPLRGVSLHEERRGKGNAVSDAERKEDIDRIVDMGSNYIRLSHYQHGDFTYHYLDSLGIICWTETPVINKIMDTEEFAVNCENGLRSLIRQLYNHPSIVVWGVSNEINYRKGPNPVPLIERLNCLVHQEDPSRPSTLAAMFSERPTNGITDVYSNNRYDGWYYNKVEEIGTFADKLHQKYPQRCIGISEYGAGAHPYHHQEGKGNPDVDGNWHPEGYQTYFHEGYLKAIQQRPYLWSTSVWAAYDFACDSRGEGNQPGINDKGLITHDRQIKKDAYYFYKVNWNPEPMVYICERRFTKRNLSETTLKLYSNCEEVVVKLNGEEIPVTKGENHIYLSGKVTLKLGLNQVEVIGKQGEKQLTDMVVWYYLPETK